jgi:hypothetical protein
MHLRHTKDIRIILPKAALSVIFDECDRYDDAETGGRIVGTYQDSKGDLAVEVSGIIGPGHNVKRSAVMLFQDGEYQEKAFRQIEEKHPTIEHLGTWHTHHMNGLQTLSGGDIETYTKTVNHHNHNIDFFYALLVVAKHRSKDPMERYSYKHFVFRRGDSQFYEIAPSHVEIVDSPLVWPVQELVEDTHAASVSRKHVTTAYRQAQHPPAEVSRPAIERVYDRDILGEFFQGVRPYQSAKLGIYWRGPIELIDGSKVEVVLMEDSSDSKINYSLVLRNSPDVLKEVAEVISKTDFLSARVALISVERLCNRVLFENANVGWKKRQE